MSKRRKTPNLKNLYTCRACFRLFRSHSTFNGCCTTACLSKVGTIEIKPKLAPPPFVELTLEKKARNKVRQKREEKKKNRDFYSTQEWFEIRYQVLKKYGRGCMRCGRTKGEMHVDHIVPRSVDRTLELVFDNLQVLCKRCNLGKMNTDSEDVRPGSRWHQEKGPDRTTTVTLIKKSA